MKNGIDIVLIKKFNELKDNSIFMEKTFTNEEINYFIKTDYNINTIAGIYAAKEAFLKAIKKGINSYPLKDIEVMHDIFGSPIIILHNELDRLIDKDNISLSISHDGEYAIASVIIF